MSKTKLTILMLAVCGLVGSVAVAQDQYPPAGYDVVNTTADISIYDPADSNLLVEVVSMDGRAVIYRGDPYDAGGGILTIDTRMDTLLLSGFSISQGDSMFATLDRTGALSTGQIYQLTAHVDFPAESYFDVDYIITFGSAPNPPSPGSGPDDGATYRGSFNYDLKNQSGSLAAASRGKPVPFATELPAGTQPDAPVDKGTRQGGDDIASATAIAAIPAMLVGQTCNFTDDYNEVCPYTNTGAPDVVYSYTATVDTGISLTTCVGGTTYDTKLYVYEDTYTPGAPHACNDDACPDYTSTIDCMLVTAGSTYYIVVDGYSATDCGDYELLLDYCSPAGPCILDCPPGAWTEAEQCGDDFNGGCNSQPPVFEDVACGVEVCGTGWASGGTRDTDWYELILTSQMTITMTGTAEFPYLAGFVDTSDCALAANVDPAGLGNPCDTFTVSRVAGPGVYYVFFAPQSSSLDIPCQTENDYWFRLDCSPVGWKPGTPHVRDTIYQIPPVGRVYVDPRRRPVIDPATGDTVGWVWHRHNVNPPDSANDTIPTIGIMNVWIGPNPPVVGQPADDVIELEGTAIIQRGEPYVGTDGHRTIETEILSMDLTGFSPVFGQTILQLPQPAQGQIRGQLPSPQTFPADVFYDVDYEVFFPDQGTSIIPLEPPQMYAQIEAIPPQDAQLTTQGEPHPVHDPQSPGVIIGWVVPIHWVDPPDTTPDPPPPDTLPTIGLMPVIQGPVEPAPTQQPDETIELSGDVIIQRQNPTTNANGHRTIETEILSMDLTGSSSLFGPVVLSVLPSPGEIVAQSPSSDFPADCFYDVDYQVDLPSMGMSVVPPAPIRMATVINEIPPFDVQLTSDGWTPMINPQDPSGDTIGWTRPIHWVNPPPPDTCDQQMPGDLDGNGVINVLDLTFLTLYVNCAGPPPAILANADVNGDCVINQADVDYLTAFLFQGGPAPVVCTCVDPTPVDCSGCPTGWTSGVDTILYSAFEIDVFDPNDNTIYLGTAYAFGAQMIVQRNAPYEETPGIWRMDTDILQFSGNGASPLLGGAFSVGLDPNGSSGGFIRMCDSCDDNWAESFFNIDYEILTSQAPPNNRLTGNAQMELPCNAGWDPSTPPHGHSYNDPRKVPIYNAGGEVIGYTMKRHHVGDTELGACCDSLEGTCRMTTQAGCDPATEVWQGPGTTCFPNPCICTGWTPGIDTILFSAFEVELFDPTDSTVSLGTITAFGSNMIVQRGVPYEPVPGSGIWRQDTQILAFGGAGSSPLTGGPFTLELDPDLLSGGYIQMCDSCDDNWAESFFDLNYRILTSLPPPENILKGNAQMHLPCDQGWNPADPPHGHQYNDPRKVPIYDADGTLIGYTMKRHRIDVDPFGACCEAQTGLCFILTRPECEAAGGTYQGDGTVCDPNPCDTTCETCWLPGIDTLLYSAFEVELFDPTDSTVSLGTLTAFGVNMIVQRGAPFEETPGIWRMNTTILQFGGAGTSPLTGGPFTIQLDPSVTSTGYIRMCDSCDDHWAEGHFTINYQILTTLPAPDDVLEGIAEMDLPCSEGWDPFPNCGPFTPPNGHTYVDPRKVPIYDADGTIIGYTMKRHSVGPDPFGACCEPQGGILCFIVSAAECEAMGGTYLGDGTVCDPNPCDTTCTTCWTPGIDTILYSTFDVDYYDPSDSTSLLGTLTAFGVNMVVQRGAPFEETPGVWRMNTTIIEFGGAGTSALTGGPFTIQLDASLASTGFIRMCDSCDDNWAESHFTVNYQILTTQPFPDDVLEGSAEMHLPCDEQWDPFPSCGPFTPPNGHTYIDPRKVPIYDAAGNLIGYTWKKHRVDKDPMGACCDPVTGACYHITAQECEAIGGIYMGNNVPCVPDLCGAQIGACCEQGTGLCFPLTRADCDAAQGTYMGDGVPCDPNPCETSCCMGPIRGNIDYDLLDQIDISDLVYLVDYMFNGGPAPQCWAEANVDCSDANPPGDGSEDIDISDLVYLVDYMFSGGPPPCPCDCILGESPCWLRGSGSSKLWEETLRKWSSHVAPTTPAIGLIGAVQ